MGALPYSAFSVHAHSYSALPALHNVFLFLCRNTTLPTLIGARPVFYRETLSKYYSPVGAGIATIALEIPWVCGLILATMPIVVRAVQLTCFFLTWLSAGSTTFHGMSRCTFALFQSRYCSPFALFFYLQYFMMGLSSRPEVFFFHYLCTIVLATVYISIGMFFSYAMPT